METWRDDHDTKRLSGFTLVEVLVVASLVAILAAILTPVFKVAKERAKAEASVGNLRQNHIAIKLYQAEWNGDGVYGERSSMGLPLDEQFYVLYSPDPPSVYPPNRIKPQWISPCGTHPDYGAIVGYHFLFWYWEGRENIEVLRAQQYQENLLLLHDINCNPHTMALDSPLTTKLGLGVLLAGNIVRHHKPGRPLWDYNWWTTRPPH